jgi:hypothetical protein
MSGEGRTGWTKKTLSDVQWWSVWAGLHGFDDRRAAESFATLSFFWESMRVGVSGGVVMLIINTTTSR